MKPATEELINKTQLSPKIISTSLMQSYPARALDRRLQEYFARDAREGLRVLMSLMVDFGPMG